MLVFLLANMLSKFLPSSSISLPSSLLLSSSVERTSVDDKTLENQKQSLPPKQEAAKEVCRTGGAASGIQWMASKKFA